MLGTGLESFKKFLMNDNNIINKIKSIKDLKAHKGCSDQQIKDAEKQLKMKFPQEYIDYVKTFGCIDFGSVEWTGLNINGRLNTVTATLQEKKINKEFPDKFFVLENLYIDSKLMIVNENNEVYLFKINTKKLIANSISEYLDICIKNAY